MTSNVGKDLMPNVSPRRSNRKAGSLKVANVGHHFFHFMEDLCVEMCFRKVFVEAVRLFIARQSRLHNENLKACMYGIYGICP